MVCDPQLYPVSAALDLDRPILPDASPKDWRWGVYKRRSLEIANLLQLNSIDIDDDFNKWAYRIRNCASWMKFRSTIDGLKLVQGNFCRVRVCPICTARKTDIWQAKTIQALPRIKQAFPPENYQFLFLTLTVKNCPISELRSTLEWMNQAFRKMTGNTGGIPMKTGKSWPGLGWIKSVEVTRNAQNNFAHPHFHCIVLVPQEYFQLGNYITQKQWVKNWQNCLEVDYQPLVGITAIENQSKQLTEGLLEVLKYEVKPNDFRGNYKWLGEYAKQVKNARFISVSGVLKDYFRFLEGSTDLIHGADSQESQRLGLHTKALIQFDWNPYHKQFISQYKLD